MSDRGDNLFINILMGFAVVAIAFVLLRNCQVQMECGDKHCEHGRAIVVRDQSKTIGFNECVCVEAPK